jgi:hypothetical protein
MSAYGAMCSAAQSAKVCGIVLHEQTKHTQTRSAYHQLQVLCIQVNESTDTQVHFEDGTILSSPSTITVNMFENQLEGGYAVDRVPRLLDTVQLSGVHRRNGFTNLRQVCKLAPADLLGDAHSTPWSYLRAHMRWNRDTLLPLPTTTTDETPPRTAAPTSVVAITNMHDLLPGADGGDETAIRLVSAHCVEDPFAMPWASATDPDTPAHHLRLELEQGGDHFQIVVRVGHHHLTANGFTRAQHGGDALYCHLGRIPLAMLLQPRRSRAGNQYCVLLYLRLDVAGYVDDHALEVERSFVVDYVGEQRVAAAAEQETRYEHALVRRLADADVCNVAALRLTSVQALDRALPTDRYQMRALTALPSQPADAAASCIVYAIPTQPGDTDEHLEEEDSRPLNHSTSGAAASPLLGSKRTRVQEAPTDPVYKRGHPNAVRAE